MRNFKLLIFITGWCLMGAPLYADIYEWTDEDGVRHFSNYAPPPEADIMMKTEEMPYDETADQVRQEAERDAQRELSRLKIAERQQALERREAQAEQRLAEAQKTADEALREAEKLLNEAREERYENENSPDYGGYTAFPGYYRGYYPHLYNDRRYYRNETGSIYFLKRPPHKSYQRHRFRNFKFDHHDKKFDRKGRTLREGHIGIDRDGRQSRFSIRSPGGSHAGRRHSVRNHSFSRWRSR